MEEIYEKSILQKQSSAYRENRKHNRYDKQQQILKELLIEAAHEMQAKLRSLGSCRRCGLRDT
jgi:hypothetical protein